MMDTNILFTVLADTTRRQLLTHLLQHGESCVCELYATLDMSQPKVSRHLAILREAELVSTRRAGTWVHYRINPALPDWAQMTLTQMATAMALEVPDCSSDTNIACCSSLMLTATQEQ